jgi:hypothetical protein
MERYGIWDKKGKVGIQPVYWERGCFMIDMAIKKCSNALTSSSSGAYIFEASSTTLGCSGSPGRVQGYFPLLQIITTGTKKENVEFE